MTSQWDRFASSASRSLYALGWSDSVEIYQPTETFEQGEGYDVAYPNQPTATLDGALSPPSEQSDVDTGGTTESIDLTVHVTSDVGVNFNGAGDTGEALTGLEVEGRKYVVEEVEDQRDGLLRLECAEVDEWR